VVNIGGQIVGLRQDAEVLDNVDWDKAYRHASEVAGLPRALLRDARDVVILRQIRAQQAQQLQEADARREDAAAIGRVGPAMQALHQMQQPALAA
jgi:CRP-like cAMP-binding protein